MLGSPPVFGFIQKQRKLSNFTVPYFRKMRFQTLGFSGFPTIFRHTHKNEYHIVVSTSYDIPSSFIISHYLPLKNPIDILSSPIDILSGNLTIETMGKSTISMAIFYSYVELPEGTI